VWFLSFPRPESTVVLSPALTCNKTGLPATHELVDGRRGGGDARILGFVKGKEIGGRF